MHDRLFRPGLFLLALVLAALPRISAAQPADESGMKSAIESAPSAAAQVSAPDSAFTPAGLRHMLLYADGGAANASISYRAPVRHPAAAFALSAAVPGAGQAYNGQWVKAAVAIALETALVTGYVITRRRGLDAEDEFREFAHQDWSPAQYASWINDYRVYLQEEIGTSISAPPVEIEESVDFTTPSAWTRAERAAVDDMFEQIRAIERQSIHPETGAAFSHQIPDFGDQQYYELIGKYFQFAPGWYDYPDWITADDMFTQAIDPEVSGPDGTKLNVSDTFFEYARDHADAQDMLRTASRISVFFIVNHLVAGIDAAVTARIRRNRVSAVTASPTFDLAWTPDGRPAPRAGVTLRF